MNRPPIAGVILAAGSSTRMGYPKPLLRYRGETFLGRLVRMFKMYCDDVLVISGEAERVEGATVVVNPAPERGMLSSLQCGFAAVRPDRAIVFTPVDYPAITESTVEGVIAGWGGELLRIPRHGGRRGHPVLVAPQLVPEFLNLPAHAEAREVVRRHEADIVYVDVEDAGILIDVDTPSDYEQLR